MYVCTVREISIRTKHFIVKNKLCQVISEKHVFDKYFYNYSKSKFNYDFMLQKINQR